MMLRSVSLLVVASVRLVGADPPGKAPAPARPPVVTVVPPEATTGDAWATLPNVKLFHPGVGGGTSTGIVIDPGAHPDMQPYPRGMVIMPPSVDPGMLLDLDDKTSVAGKLFSGIRNSLGTLLQLVVPPTI